MFLPGTHGCVQLYGLIRLLLVECLQHVQILALEIWKEATRMEQSKDYPLKNWSLIAYKLL